VLANRENNSEALPYLTKAVENYEAAIAACKNEDKATIIADSVNLNALDKYLLNREINKASTTAGTKVDKIIHSGMELNVLEAGYT